MKIIAAAFVGLLFALPLQANPIEESDVFKLLVGNWTGKGELVDQDGNKTEVSETWEGKLTEEGSFLISGQRKLGQGEHEFSWEFFANGDLIEGQMKMSEPEVERRFEIVLNEVEQSVAITIPLGGGSVLKVKNTLSEDKKKIEGTVSIEDESGAATTTGTVNHEKTDS